MVSATGRGNERHGTHSLHGAAGAAIRSPILVSEILLNSQGMAIASQSRVAAKSTFSNGIDSRFRE